MGHREGGGRRAVGVQGEPDRDVVAAVQQFRRPRGGRTVCRAVARLGAVEPRQAAAGPGGGLAAGRALAVGGRRRRLGGAEGDRRTSGAVTTTGSDHGPVPTVFAAATVYVPAARSGVPSTREVPVVLPITPSMQAADSATSTTYDRAPGTGSQLSLTWPSSPVS